MLPKINRIKKKKDFDIIFKKGKSFKTSLLVLKMLKNGSDQNRFGFIISQKVSKKAVVRNKIRRRLAEIAKINLNKSYVGFDFVFIIMPIAGQKSFSEIAECVKNIINKI